MELFPRRRYFFCAYCGTFEFIDPEAHDELRVLAATDPPLPCPVCATTLGHALLDAGIQVLHCARCRGVLLPRASFVQVVERRRASAKGPGKIPAPLDRRELERVVTCSQCRKRMDVHPYYGPGNVIIDTCAQCDAVWLDSGELGQITDAPGKDRRR
jgi:Zn-finger nucleic acid-binding protein